MIIHEIPKVNRADKQTLRPNLSEVPSELDDRLRTYFRERITNSIRKQKFDAVYDPPQPTIDEDGTRRSRHRDHQCPNSSSTSLNWTAETSSR